jgi:predicted homoserine dehydrogenase-like protein
MVYGKLMSAQTSLAAGGLPIGLAHNLVLQRAVPSGQAVRWEDVAFDESNGAIRFRREMEAAFRTETEPLRRAS